MVAVVYSWKDKGRVVQLMDGTHIPFIMRNSIAMGHVGKQHLKEILETKVGCCGHSRLGFRLATEEELMRWKGETND